MPVPLSAKHASGRIQGCIYISRAGDAVEEAQALTESVGISQKETFMVYRLLTPLPVHCKSSHFGRVASFIIILLGDANWCENTC